MDMDNSYPSAESVRLKKRLPTEASDQKKNESEIKSFSNVTNSIDETLRLLKESVDQL